MTHRTFTHVMRSGAIWLCLVPAAVLAQPDPLALQQQAIQRIDGVVAHMRKTGERQSQIVHLEQAQADLSLSNRQLAQRGDQRALARGLLKEGHTFRLRGQWPLAIGLYQQALGAAIQSGDGGLQSESLAWKAQAESYRQEPGQALADATEAVRLAEQAGSKDQLAHALNTLEGIQIEQGDLIGAATTINKELTAAAQAKDPMAMVYALLGRQSVYYTQGSKCDYKVVFKACKQFLEQANADIKKSMEILNRLGYGYLIANTNILAKAVEGQLTLLRSHEQLAQSLQQASEGFSPRDASRVVVNEQFISSVSNGNFHAFQK